MNRYISSKLEQNSLMLIGWSMLAAFGAYFCTYAVRKPFATGLYLDYQLWGISYKVILVITQVLGYMCSKFIGIRVISGLNTTRRILLILSLISISILALLLFGLVGFPYNWIFLFFNGLPLGMVWGIIFSFLEGRRYTELIALGLSINMISTSGILKSMYLFFQQWLGISEFLMPLFMALLFMPFMVFFVWMLAQIPPPKKEDIQLRAVRVAMTKTMKMKVIIKYGIGIFCLMVVYTVFTSLRDYRDNFAVEIWKSIAPEQDYKVFMKVESLIVVVVLLIVGSLITIKNNFLAYRVINSLMIVSVLLGGVATYAFESHIIGAFGWMVLLGIGLFLPYLLIQIAVFERLIALFKMKANAGYLVYICDSMGYLGSVFVLIYKEFFTQSNNWGALFIQFSKVSVIISALFLVAQLAFFTQLHRQKRAKIKTTF